MNGPMPSLSSLQQWMQTVITHPQGVGAGVLSEEARELIRLDSGCLETIILPSRALDSTARLSIYADAYYTRLIKCLQELFPALRYAVGEEVFDDFAFAYLQVYPSRSYTLGHLARHFIDYLESTRDEYLVTGETGVPEWARFLVELARLEHTIDEVFDGPGVEELANPLQEALAATPAEQWQRVRLHAAPSLRLLSFEFPVNDYFTDYRRGGRPEIPEPAPSYLAIHRRNYIVRRYPLCRSQFEILRQLAADVPLETALTLAASSAGTIAAPQLSSWFAQWAAEDFFVQLDLSLSQTEVANV